MTVVGLLISLLAAFLVPLERAEAVECDDVKVVVQNACRDELGIGQYPHLPRSLQRIRTSNVSKSSQC